MRRCLTGPLAERLCNRIEMGAIRLWARLPHRVKGSILAVALAITLAAMASVCLLGILGLVIGLAQTLTS